MTDIRSIKTDIQVVSIDNGLADQDLIENGSLRVAEVNAFDQNFQSGILGGIRLCARPVK